MQREFIIIVGQQGCGKTHWCKEYTKSNNNIFIFDPIYSYPRCFDFESYDYDDLKNIIENQNVRCQTDNQSTVPMLSNVAYACARKSTIVIEECALFFPKKIMPLEPWLKRIVFAGRHTETNVLFIAQRAASIPIDVRSQASRIVSFRQTEPADVAAISRSTGFTRELIADLQNFHCADWHLGDRQIYTV